MNVTYQSTRGSESGITASQAILKGLASDGGLFVPDHFPKLDKTVEELIPMNYREVAYEVMKLFLTDFTAKELKDCISKAYDKKFDTDEIVPIHRALTGYYMELYHGPTLAFKDMALTMLPHLMTTAAKKNHDDKEIVILTATSGDTGKAALAGFADVPGTKICVFYPKKGVSPFQELQMVTQKGKNVKVVGINGNFDDAQTGVKQIFTDEALRAEMAKKGMQFSSANSINIGRLVPQIVYYVWAYTRLVKENIIRNGEEINFSVPTGNFGDILAGYYAKQLGVPIRHLICASNINNVLTDFFETGIYDKNREFFVTQSPSMDIVVSSNLERLIYHISGGDAQLTADLMERLRVRGSYEISAEMRDKLTDFIAGYADEGQTAREMRALFYDGNYLIDPHTAVASGVWEYYREKKNDWTRTVVVSTASPFKFAWTVLAALGKDPDAPGIDLEKELSELSGLPIPKQVLEVRKAPVLHNEICNRDRLSMELEVRSFLGL